MGIKYSEQDLSNLKKDLDNDDAIIITLYDVDNNRILCEKDKDKYFELPYLFRISRKGLTPINKYISDRKHKIGYKLFNIKSESQKVFYLNKCDNKILEFNDDDGNYLYFDLKKKEITEPPLDHTTEKKKRRYKGTHIGESQNQFVRSILSQLGNKKITKDDWENAKNDFGYKCAYCGETKPLEIDHAVPINREYLGEHEIGNLIPCCRDCNNKKHNKSFDEYLDYKSNEYIKVKKYMDSHGYIPLKRDENSSEIIDIIDQYRKMIEDIANKCIHDIELLRKSE